MDFISEENKDGIRMSWNILPNSKQDSNKLSVPIAAMYTPLKQYNSSVHHDNDPNITQSQQQQSSSITVNYPPIVCKNDKCRSILNPYCNVDYINKAWVCCFCLQRNTFPHHYSDISHDNTPAELLHQYSSMEYIIQQQQYNNNNNNIDNNIQSSEPPVFLFVIDTCIYAEELVELKKSLLQSLLLMPENSLVGIITYGRNVYVHEISWDESNSKSYVFRGNKYIDTQQLAKMLNFKYASTINQADQNKNITSQPTLLTQQKNTLQHSIDNDNRRRFLLSASEAEYQISNIIESLDIDRWQYPAGQRQDRCTGSALCISIGLLELTCKYRNSRILLFSGGPCTVGPGQVASNDMKNTIRSHVDITKGNIPYYKSAVKFYDDIANRALNNGHIIDIFACSLDQIGISEMKNCTSCTGGNLVLDDSFTHNVFNGSFRRLFSRENDVYSGNSELSMGFQGTLQVVCSRELKLTGCIGHVTSEQQEAPHVSKDKEVGVGNTYLWSVGGIDTQSTYCIYFDINGTIDIQNNNQQQHAAHIQFITKYKHSNGSYRQRVTTIRRLLVNSTTTDGQSYIRYGFDQECSACIIARQAVYKLDNNEYISDVIRWIDKTLINLVSSYGIYTKDDPNSFRLDNVMAYYPQFIFHLRRSQFIQIFNSSPDETTFFRHTLLKENTTNTIIMIQPTLTAYSLDGPAQPVLLDTSSISSQRILLLDTYFHIVLWYGDTISQWRNQGLHLQPEYEYLNILLNTPLQDAQLLIDNRFPAPRFIECVEKGSQSRFLMAKLNPSITHSNVQQQYAPDGTQIEAPVFTEDVSLKVFMEFLRKLAVTNSS